MVRTAIAIPPRSDAFIYNTNDPRTLLQLRRFLAQAGTWNVSAFPQVCVDITSVDAPGGGWNSVAVPVSIEPIDPFSFWLILGPAPSYNPVATETLRVKLSSACLELHSDIPAFELVIDVPPKGSSVDPAVEAVFSGIATVFGAAVSPVAPVVMLDVARAGSLYELAACRHDRDASVPWYQHPLRFSIGDGYAGESMGAVVGNTVAVAAVPLLHAAVAEVALAATLVPRDGEQSARVAMYRKLRAPLGGFFASVVLMQATAASAIRVVQRGTTVNAAIAVVLLLLQIAPWVYVGYRVQFKFGAHWRELSTKGAGVPAWRPWLVGPGMWADSGNGLVKDLGALFVAYTQRCRAGLVAEVLVSLIIGCIVGARPSVTGCAPSAIGVAVLVGLRAAALGLRPFLALARTAWTAAVSLLLIVAAIVVVAAGDDASASTGVLPTLVLFVLVALAVVEGAAWVFVLRQPLFSYGSRAASPAAGAQQTDGPATEMQQQRADGQQPAPQHNQQAPPLYADPNAKGPNDGALRLPVPMQDAPAGVDGDARWRDFRVGIADERPPPEYRGGDDGSGYTPAVYGAPVRGPPALLREQSHAGDGTGFAPAVNDFVPSPDVGERRTAYASRVDRWAFSGDGDTPSPIAAGGRRASHLDHLRARSQDRARLTLPDTFWSDTFGDSFGTTNNDSGGTDVFGTDSEASV